MEQTKKMKVLIIADGYPSKENTTPNIFVHNQAVAIKKRNIEVDVLVVDMRSFRRKRELGFYHYEYDGINVYRQAFPCGPLPYICEQLSRWVALRGFQNYIMKNGKPDIIHAHFGMMGFCARGISQKYHIPYIVTEHGTSLIDGKMKSYSKKMYSISYNNAYKVISVSEYLKSYMTAFTTNRIDVIPNILPNGYDYFEGEKNEEFTYISVARLAKIKGIDRVIDAFKKIADKYDNVRYEIIGEGPEKEALANQIKFYKLDDRVRLLGTIENTKLPEFYNRAHCFVLPSEYETFGVVYREALACGLPTVATKCGGVEDCVNDKNGFLIEINDSEALYNAMESVMLNYAKYPHKEISKEVRSVCGESIIGECLVKLYKDTPKV